MDTTAIVTESKKYKTWLEEVKTLAANSYTVVDEVNHKDALVGIFCFHEDAPAQALVAYKKFKQRLFAIMAELTKD